MLLQQLQQRFRVTRRVAVSAGMDIIITDANEAYFAAALTEPTDNPSDASAPPREDPPHILRYPDSFQGPAGAALRAGDRVDEWGSVGTLWELLRNPRPLRNGRAVEGWQVPVMPVTTLYPFVATLHEQGGTQVAVGVRVAVWGGDDRQESAGTYEDMDGEAPVEHTALAGANRHLMVGAHKLRIIETVTDYKAPRVRLRLRRPGG